MQLDSIISPTKEWFVAPNQTWCSMFWLNMILKRLRLARKGWISKIKYQIDVYETGSDIRETSAT